jgi:P-type Mg2+ transporter
VLVLLAIRSRRPLLSSTPSRALVIATAAVLLAAVLFVQTPAGTLLGLPALAPHVLLVLAGITLAYVTCVELVKKRLYRTGYTA